VIRGDMSLVGPRPLPIGMRTDGLLCSDIVEEYAHRHRVKPGLTGWAQVNGSRGATHLKEQVKERVAYDLEYIQNWSILFDLQILLRTIWVVVKCDSAF
ncbi:MAG: sugar transferase, partial [Alphaproteobacteria bacterium]